MTSSPRKPVPVLPELKLPLAPWLGAPPLACLIVGGVGYGVCLAIGVDQPIGTIWGGLATAIGMLIAALAVLPWIPRPLNEWANLLLGGQLFSFMSTVGAGVVLWLATDTAPAPLGMTGAAAFLVGQLVQVSVFQAASRPIEKRLKEEGCANAD
ncbi:MAG: hypothetical protein ACF8MJ_05445 [Phycisphaerales bacterium JB050]